MREVQVTEIRFLLFKCVDCARILEKLVRIVVFTYTPSNRVDETVDSPENNRQSGRQLAGCGKGE